MQVLDAGFRGAKSRLAAELSMLIVDVDEMNIDTDTAEFVADSARGLVADVEDAVNERELSRIEADLGRLQVVVHQALKRGAGPPTSSTGGVRPAREGGKDG